MSSYIALLFCFRALSLSHVPKIILSFMQIIRLLDLAIFSDNANNIMTCYINGNPWRTFDRVFKPCFVQTDLKLNIEFDAKGVQDTLMIKWIGDFKDS